MKELNLKPVIKRVGAYLIDIIIIMIISSLITYIPPLNQKYQKYQDLLDEFNILYNEYTETNTLINDITKDNEITEEEYNKLKEKAYYKEYLKDITINKSVDKDKIDEIKENITTSYTKEAETYNYKLEKLSIYNSLSVIICTFLYFTILQYFLKGQTIGKKIFKIKVISTKEKQQVSLPTYFLRSLIVNNIFLNTVNILFLKVASQQVYLKSSEIINLLVSVVEAIIIYLVITREDHKGLHDIICKTKVEELK